MAASIKTATIRRILDSRGNATVEVDLTSKEATARAAAPSGASTGANEVRAFPDGGAEVSIRVFRRKVASKLVGMDAGDQEAVDALLHEVDGTEDFSALGGNAAVATSLATARLAAAVKGVPLWAYIAGGARPKPTFPAPMGNVIGGGAHAVGGTDIQEYLAFTRKAPPSKSIFANALVHRLVKESLKESFPGQPIGKGDEGAWIAPTSNDKAMQLLARCCQRAAETTGLNVVPALDFAATEFHRSGRYHYRQGALTSEEQVEYVAMLVESHGIASVEDPLAENEFGAFADLTRRVGQKCLVVGDDIFTTNVERIKRGIKEGSANAVLIKVNQIGTLTDTLAAVNLAKSAGWETVTSHRSGETTDDSIAHLAVAFGSVGIKTGAVGGERTAKLNELVRIEEAAQARAARA